MGLAKGYEYVKTVGGKIYVRGSCFQDYHANNFDAAEARELADTIVKAADKLDRTSGSKLDRGSGEVTLTLTRGEAAAVSAVLYRVGGHPKTSPRGKVASVLGRLTAAGVKPLDHEFETVAGGLWFKNHDGTSTDEWTKLAAEFILACGGQ